MKTEEIISKYDWQSKGQRFDSAILHSKDKAFGGFHLGRFFCLRMICTQNLFFSIALLILSFFSNLPPVFINVFLWLESTLCEDSRDEVAGII